MLQYSTVDAGLQVIFDNSTGEFVGEVLRDDKFAWTKRKTETIRLSNIYSHAGMQKEAQRAAGCSTWLEYLAMEDGRRQLRHFNACKMRLCPLCTARRAKLTAHRLTRVLNVVEKSNPGIRFLFLTLTVKNCDGKDLSDTITQLLKAFYRLVRNRRIERAVKGWFRALEITRNAKDNTYHPHLHLILAVGADYFDKNQTLYIPHAEWVDRWAKSLRVNYKPVVGIQVAKDKAGRRKGTAIAAEAAKYATKSSEYISAGIPLDVAAEVVRVYTPAVRGRRLLAYGGILKDAAAELDIQEDDDDDLVHLDDSSGELREDIAELIETYNWHFAAGDYVLSSREANPDLLVESASADDGANVVAVAAPPSRVTLDAMHEQNKPVAASKKQDDDDFFCFWKYDADGGGCQG